VLPARFVTETGMDPHIGWAVVLALAGFVLIFLFEGLSKNQK
jgi:hypothetical protein